jgi:3-hydroxyisobutyrate dehydrogenase
LLRRRSHPLSGHALPATVGEREGEYEEGLTLAPAGKDLRLALDLVRSAGVPAELSAVVEQLFARARAAFGDDAGEMTPVRLYEETAGVLLRLPAEELEAAA